MSIQVEVDPGGRQGYHRRASSTGITEWPTPQWLVDQLAEEFGTFDLDPAAAVSNAKAPAFFTEEVDGLAREWKGRVWLNPPYGKFVTPRWLAKAKHEVDLGHADLVVCLVPARVETAWWRECEADPQVFTRVIGRIRWKADERGEAPFPSAVIVFGHLTGRHGRYPATCSNPACPRPYRRFWPAYRNRETCSERCRKARYRLRVSQVQSQNGDTA
jgi:site-specific DNA-methyltransferase (adenine-specific)